MERLKISIYVCVHIRIAHSCCFSMINKCNNFDAILTYACILFSNTGTVFVLFWLCIWTMMTLSVAFYEHTVAISFVIISSVPDGSDNKEAP